MSFRNDEECTACHDDVIKKPNITLLVSTTCGHKLCDKCVEQFFRVQPERMCPVCRQIIRERDFMGDLEDAKKVFSKDLDKELKLRKKFMEDIYMRRENFATDEDYNKYLEDVEDIIYSIMNNDGEAQALQKKALLKDQARACILDNLSKKTKDRMEMEAKVTKELDELESANHMALQEEINRRKKANEEKAMELESIAQTGTVEEKPVVKAEKVEVKPAKVDKPAIERPRPAAPAPPPKKLTVTKINRDDETPEEKRTRQETAVLAAGYSRNLANKRDWEEALASLLAGL